MNSLNNKAISLLVAIALAAVFVLSAPDGWRTFSQLADRQESANNALMQWKASYEALLPVNDAFAKTYPSGDDAKDLVSLYRLANLERHGLKGDIDLVRQTEVSAVTVNDVPVGLQRLCMGNEGESMMLAASSIRQLSLGLQSLANRKDIELGSIEMSMRDGVPVAKVAGVCLLVRTERNSGSEGGA